VYGIPVLNGYCPPDLCSYFVKRVDDLLNGKLNAEMQRLFAPASYWKDPFAYDTYLAKNDFLADINNERAHKNSTYRARLLSLNTLALQYSTADHTVVPRTSPWFSFYAVGQDSVLTPWNQSAQYVGDWIGMRTLHEQGRLQLSTINCTHGLIPDNECEWAYNLYTRPLLNNTLPAMA
jgi:palmitoyl-protein thioesterase